MKKTLSILFVTILLCKLVAGQEKNLKLVQVLTFDSTINLNSPSGTNVSLNVPVNKYWKIENLTLSPPQGCMAIFGINNTPIWFNPTSIYNPVTYYTYQGPPIWTKPGNTLNIWTNQQVSTGSYSYRLVIFEFILE